MGQIIWFCFKSCYVNTCVPGDWVTSSCLVLSPVRNLEQICRIYFWWHGSELDIKISNLASGHQEKPDELTCNYESEHKFERQTNHKGIVPSKSELVNKVWKKIRWVGPSLLLRLILSQGLEEEKNNLIKRQFEDNIIIIQVT